MALYHKYRPTSFDKVVGNRAVIQALQGALENNPPHAILIEGPTGCGKTTLARIVARELGAVGMDFMEVDSADFRGIDTIREIRRQAQFAPMESGVRVFLLDECHKLSGDAQNALLKILEDTPKHAYFILATTDPQKLLATIKGRTSTYKVGLLNEVEMIKLLRKVVKAEEESLAKVVYEQIAADSLGHPRNALQILDQVLRVDEGDRLQVAERSAEEQSQSIELCRALIAATTWKKISAILKGLKTEDPEGIRRHVLGYASAVLLNKDDIRIGLVLEEFAEPFYNGGFPLLVRACYAVNKG